MGLDMFANRIKMPQNELEAMYKLAAEGELPEDTPKPESVEIHYWRKHPDLHGWMQQKYAQRSGDENPENFNCVDVILGEDDLNELEEAVKSGSLPSTSGFFFGSSQGDEEEGDLEFIQKAREAIKEGDSVIYSSWW